MRNPQPVFSKNYSNRPDLSLGRQISGQSCRNLSLCWTCSSCDLECPVNIATGRLRPQKIVRMANLGFSDELSSSPDIWYCLTCRRCTHICPNSVRPSTLIVYARRNALESGFVSMDTLRQYQDLFTQFQRIRWHAINICFKKNIERFNDQVWIQWANKPAKSSDGVVNLNKIHQWSIDINDILDSSQLSSCYTCGECSSACPIVCDGFIFDPRRLFRMINLGLVDELLGSPSIWLCLSCGRCTDSCSQLVDGRLIFDKVKEFAIHKGIVDFNFFKRVEYANQLIYNHFISKIDSLFKSTQKPHFIGRS